ncbi:MAG: UDP-N-acetylmuramate dehydrogenase [Oscillospiraceae bacterium]|nr:UDP-N-acetylmuramate dehydrogenase [Oscillospiraceae bacterium]
MTSISLLKQEISRILPAFAIRAEEPLARHTSFRIGGPAELMVFPRRVEELSGVMACAAAHSVRPRILGAGTNVLAPDEGLRGLVIVTREALMGLALREGTQVEAMAGMSLAETAMFAARNRLSGLEFAHGIPGTVGGGLYMNAGAYGGELCQVALRTEFMDLRGQCHWVEGAEQGFAYRSSAFQSMDGVIVRTVFALTPGDEKDIRARMQELAQKRRASQPLELPSAGSAFKRPQGAYAAALIEQAGLKGLRVGGAAVSEKHAGFVVNLGGATAADVLRLVELVQERVLADSGFRLEPEVRLWGAE